MTPSGRATRILVALSAALLAAYAIVWAHLTPFDIGRSDFTAFYVGGTLLREGRGPELYDESLQAQLHARLIAPDHEGNLPFVDPPVAAALVLPVTVLGLDPAYRIWALVELAVLAGAVVVAVRSVRGASKVGRVRIWTSGLVAMAGVGTLFDVSQAQWTAILALGVAIAYRAWHRDAAVMSPSPCAGTATSSGSRAAAFGAAALVACALVGKPQLALGLVAFMVGWRRRAVLLGAAAGLGAVGAVSLAIAGPAGLAGLVRIVAGSTTRWDPHPMLGVSGVAAAFAGGGPPAVVLGVALSLAACAAAYVLGSGVRRDTARLSFALAGAAALSLVAAPHAYLDDLAMLAPAAAWCLVSSEVTSSAPAAGRQRTQFRVVLGLWAVVNAAAVADLVAQGHLPTGPVTGYALALTGGLALAATRGQRTLRLGYRAGDEAALGTMAHGLRRW